MASEEPVHLLIFSPGNQGVKCRRSYEQFNNHVPDLGRILLSTSLPLSSLGHQGMGEGSKWEGGGEGLKSPRRCTLITWLHPVSQHLGLLCLVGSPQAPIHPFAPPLQSMLTKHHSLFLKASFILSVQLPSLAANSVHRARPNCSPGRL